jgi:hypothetical protein
MVLIYQSSAKTQQYGSGRKRDYLVALPPTKLCNFFSHHPPQPQHLHKTYIIPAAASASRQPLQLFKSRWPHAPLMDHWGMLPTNNIIRIFTMSLPP